MTFDVTQHQALSFDCYGTLIDWESGIAAIIGPWARRNDSSITDEQVLVVYANNESAVVREFPAMLYPDVLRESFRRTGTDLKFEVSDLDADSLGTSVPDWPAFPDSAEALARLKKRYKLVILSNVDRESFVGSNRRLGVEFDEILTAQDIGSYKPAQANFTALLRRADEIGLNGKLIHVAQSLFHDHVPAKERGLPTIWINRRHAKPGWGATPAPGIGVTPDLEFSSMSAFADAVDEAFGE